MRFVLAANAAVLAAAWIASLAWAPPMIRMLASATLVLVAPGVGWLGAFARAALDLPRLALAVVGISSLVCVATAGLAAVTVGSPSSLLVWLSIGLAMNVGFLVCGTPRRLDATEPWNVLAVAGAFAFVASAAAATMLVPPLEDHDMEVRGTAYGLVSDFKPYFLTNREVFLPMAHPPLFHFHVAESLILTGEIDATRPSYDSARRAERALASGGSFPSMEQWRSDHRAFVDHPALAGTRAPAALFSALVVALLCDVVIRMTASRLAGIAAAVLYVSFPETVVRSAYAGYFSVTVFAMLVGAMLFERRNGGSPGSRADLAWLVAAGAFAALVDHKTVVVVLAVAALAGLRAVREAWRLPAPRSVWRRVPELVDRRALALGAGFSAATFAWWGYALAVDSRTFVQDHLRMHIAHRFLLNDLRIAHDASRYAPSMAELWLEFTRHTGYVFVPVAAAGIATWIFGRRRSDLAAVLAAWIVVGSVLYTLTDWRQTKHLMNGLAPAVAAAVVLVWSGRNGEPAPGPGAGRPRIAVPRVLAGAALVAALGANLVADARLIADFRSLTISGASDVDGW